MAVGVESCFCNVVICTIFLEIWGLGKIWRKEAKTVFFFVTTIWVLWKLLSGVKVPHCRGWCLKGIKEYEMTITNIFDNSKNDIAYQVKSSSYGKLSIELQSPSENGNGT